jgi:hypothetical protein
LEGHLTLPCGGCVGDALRQGHAIINAQ